VLNSRFLAYCFDFLFEFVTNVEGAAQIIDSYLKFPSVVVRLWIDLVGIYLAVALTTSVFYQVPFSPPYGQHLISNCLASILQSFCYDFVLIDPFACSKFLIGRFFPYLFVD
jgi:hypothetical protein